MELLARIKSATATRGLLKAIPDALEGVGGLNVLSFDLNSIGPSLLRERSETARPRMCVARLLVAKAITGTAGWHLTKAGLRESFEQGESKAARRSLNRLIVQDALEMGCLRALHGQSHERLILRSERVMINTVSTPNISNSMKSLAYHIPVLMLVVFVSGIGCGRDPVYQTRLTGDEIIAHGAPVLVDHHPAGHVKDLRVDAGERIAVLTLTEPSLRRSLHVGTVRVIEDGRIHLRTDAVKPDAPRLVAGAFIPSQSRTEFTVARHANTRTAVWVVIGIVGLLVLCFCTKFFFNLGLLLISLLLAALTAVVTHGYLAPHIQDLYDTVPAHRLEARADHTGSSTLDAVTSLAPWETHLVSLLDNYRPDPRLVAFVAITVVAFVLYAIVLGWAVRALRRR